MSYSDDNCICKEEIINEDCPRHNLKNENQRLLTKNENLQKALDEVLRVHNMLMDTLIDSGLQISVLGRSNKIRREEVKKN